MLALDRANIQFTTFPSLSNYSQAAVLGPLFDGNHQVSTWPELQPTVENDSAEDGDEGEQQKGHRESIMHTCSENYGIIMCIS
jgi:hypothetical protein